MIAASSGGPAALRLRVAEGALCVVTTPIDAHSAAAARVEDCDLTTHANAKRVAEHKSGRTAARIALELAWGAHATTMQIRRTAVGPHLGAPAVHDASGHAVPGMLSISHAGTLACAAFAAAPVGVDLVAAAEVDDAVAREALSEAERTAWRTACPQLPSDALAFATKEAAVKLLQRGFGLSWVATTVLPHRPTAHGADPLDALAHVLAGHRFGVRVTTPEHGARDVQALTVDLAGLWLVVLLAAPR